MVRLKSRNLELISVTKLYCFRFNLCEKPTSTFGAEMIYMNGMLYTIGGVQVMLPLFSLFYKKKNNPVQSLPK